MASLTGVSGGSLCTIVLTLYGKPIHQAVATSAGTSLEGPRPCGTTHTNRVEASIHAAEGPTYSVSYRTDQQSPTPRPP